MDRILRLNEFFVEGGKQTISHVLLHISEPTTPEEIAKGYFFAVCEINNAETKYFTRIKDLIDRASNDYYDIPDTADKNALELVLEKLNQEALTLVSSDIELHCVVGAIRQPEIIFTFYGKPAVLVFYKNQQGIYQSMDLVQANSETSDQPTQLFSHIIQGKISANDFMFTGTPHINEYFSADRLQKIITSRPAVQSAQHIERVLSEIKNGYSFGGLIMHIDRPDSGPIPIRKAPMVKGASSKSLHSLFNREESTANTLSPSLMPRLRALMSRNSVEVDDMAPTPQNSVQPAEINAAHVSHRQGGANRSTSDIRKDIWAERIKAVLSAIVKTAVVLGKAIALIAIFIYGFIYGLVRNFLLLFFVITNYQNRRQPITDTWRKNWHGFITNIRQLPTFTKAIFLMAILVIAGAAAGVAVVRYRQQIAEHTRVFEETIQQIKNKKDAMESALIYKDDQAAYNELASAEELLKNLSCLSKEEKALCETLQVQFDDLITRIKKITKIEPEVIYTWTIDGPIENLAKVNTKLIGFSRNTTTLFVYDLLSRESKTIASGVNAPGFSKASVPKENDYVLLSSGIKDFYKIDPADISVKPSAVFFSNDKATISDFVVYNRRLYTLDSTNNQIYKHDSTKNGFDQGKDWIKDGTLVKEGQELIIDGDMFVLNNNGSITKFTAGVSQPFNLLGIDPAIGAGASIWTYTDQRYIFIADPVNKRIIILEKDGRIKEQLMADTFVNPTGLAVDTANNALYLVDSNRLLKIILPQ